MVHGLPLGSLWIIISMTVWLMWWIKWVMWLSGQHMWHIAPASWRLFRLGLVHCLVSSLVWIRPMPTPSRWKRPQKNMVWWWIEILNLLHGPRLAGWDDVWCWCGLKLFIEVHILYVTHIYIYIHIYIYVCVYLYIYIFGARQTDRQAGRQTDRLVS